MMLIEQGRLSLLDPVERYLPEMAAMQVGRVVEAVGAAPRIECEPLRRPISLHDLLRHTSGIPYGVTAADPVKLCYVEAGLGGDKIIGNDAFDNAGLITRLAQLPLVAQPGETFEYGMSTDVLGRVVEVVSGQTLAQFVCAHITGPLGMPDTGFHAPPEQAHRAAHAQIVGPCTQPKAMPPVTRAAAFESGGGGMVSTIADYARLCLFWRNGGALDGVRLLSPKTVALMISNHLPASVRLGADMVHWFDATNMPTPELGLGFGLGFAVRTAAGLNPLPGSVGDYSWGGVYGTHFWIDPQEDLFAIVMLQSIDLERPYCWSARVMREGVYQALVA